MAPVVGELGPHSGRYNSMASVGNPATILLVDDDEAIRRFVRPILQQQGFHVIEASDGAESIEVASVYAQPVDSLFDGFDGPRY
jgi:response regulator RpfG family c-di-GMP phosphodiesterase